MLPMPPRPIRLLTAAICACILLSALATGVLAIVVPPKPAWTLMAFEVVMAVSCSLALPFARGAYRDGPGLALTCFAGAVFAGSVLGYLSAQGVLGTHSLKLWLLARVALAGLLGLFAAAVVLVRNPRSWGGLIKGLLLLSPHALIVVLFGLQRYGPGSVKSGLDRLLGVFAPLTRPAEGVAEAMRMGGLIVIAIIAGGLLCAGLHLIIRSFEICRDDESAVAKPRPA